jgi:hypothetical protein
METSQQEAIGQVIEFTGLDPVDDRELVIQALKVSIGRTPQSELCD